jgi:hypothetical protein
MELPREKLQEEVQEVQEVRHPRNQPLDLAEVESQMVDPVGLDMGPVDLMDLDLVDPDPVDQAVDQAVDPVDQEAVRDPLAHQGGKYIDKNLVRSLLGRSVNTRRAMIC